MSLLQRPRAGLRPEPRLPKRETAVGHVIALALSLAGAGMIVSAAVDKLDGGSDAMVLLASGAIVGIPGFALWNRTRSPGRIPAATIFAAVLFGWLTFVVAAAVPYYATGVLDRFDLALFEAVAGATATAASVLLPIEGTGAGLLFWRASTQWIGGIAAVVFAVSVLPFLGVGGMELIRSDAAGPASERLGPRVRATASRLVPIYAAFTLVVAIAYVAFGMGIFDGVTHAFTTVSTGGFSTRDASFAHFDSAALEWVAVVAMIVAGSSLVLLWRAVRGRPLVIVRSAEFRAYLFLTLLICIAAVAWNAARDGMDAELLRRTIFTTVSITTTTGYRMLDFDAWAPVVQLVLIFAMALGGMAGSPAGGFKVFRLLAVLGYARRQLFTQLHPRAVSVVRFGRDVVSEVVMTRIVGFFGLFMAAGGAATFLVAAFGADIRTAISAVASAIGNTGPGLGEVGPMRHFVDVGAGIRAVLMAVMLVGRLEVYAVLLGAVPLARFVGDRLPRSMARALVRSFRG